MSTFSRSFFKGSVLSQQIVNIFLFVLFSLKVAGVLSQFMPAHSKSWHRDPAEEVATAEPGCVI